MVFKFSLRKKHNPFLFTLQRELYSEYLALLKQENMFWKLKSRVTWLSSRDQNTIFFHNSTINRRRKNKILGLKLDSKIWEINHEKLETHIVEHFQNIFSTSHIYRKQPILYHVPDPA